jgi:hypothetical protein
MKDPGSMWKRLAIYEDMNIKRIRIKSQKDIWPSFSRLFGGRKA